MSLLQMSFSGAVLISVILILRAFFINKLPKRTFLALWWLALLRLMLPVAVPSGFSAWSMVRSGLAGSGLSGESAHMLAFFLPGLQDGQGELDEISGIEAGQNGAGRLHSLQTVQNGENESPGLQTLQNVESENPWLHSLRNGESERPGLQLLRNSEGKITNQTKEVSRNNSGLQKQQLLETGIAPRNGQNETLQAGTEEAQITGKRSPGQDSGFESALFGEVFGGSRMWGVIWGIGALLCAGFFISSYVLCRLEFRMTLPVKDEFTEQWMKAHPLRRIVSIRSSDRISAPLTYGIFRPVILLPGKADRVEPVQMEYVLLHEYVHICRLDAVTKLLIALALCIHWFNPFVWVMYILFNRDIELVCDEQVIRRLGMDKRASYALTLIDMEEKKRSLMPLCNGFGRNAGKNTMKERITAIMKIKKTSVCGILAATVLVASVTTVFATTTVSENKTVCTVPGTDFTEQEYDMLLALRFEGYEDMTVSEFQNKVWEMTDTAEYRDLLDRFAEDETLDNLKEENDIASFLHYCLLPLTAEKWKVRSFGGFAVSDPEGAMDRVMDHAVLEYFLTLVIKDGDTLKVGDYLETRAGIFAELDAWLAEKSEDELQDAQKMSELLDKEREALHQKWDSDSLMVNVESFFAPLMYYSGNGQEDNPEDAELLAMSLKEREAQWAENLAPYMPFGLTYEYDQPTDDFKMYYEGKEVRGLTDEERGIWITEHSGIGRGIYAEDAIELYAVYEKGVLQGLRAATEEEQAEWDRKRQDTSDGRYEGNAPEEEESWGESGTEADYNSLLKLMTSDYRELTVADFNMRLLDWTNENRDRMERITRDTQLNDFQVPLDEEERNFVTLTVLLSGTENGEYVRSNYTGRKEDDPVYDRYLPEKSITVSQMDRVRSAEGMGSAEGMRSAEDTGSTEGMRSAEGAGSTEGMRSSKDTGSTGGMHSAEVVQPAENGDGEYMMAAWCDLYYQFSYHIADKKTVTIAQRDACIGGMIKGVEDFWNETDLEEMLKMTKKDILEKLRGIAAEHSDEQVAITVREDFVGFEKMDERDLWDEKDLRY
ncbi:MAG TPA: hypothetical protein DCZ91_23800 [Lachnospiraceae bacterium]|nr:hypothetical protein [Lachnospiraceae bacterium]